jgi:hypothetical protein
MPRSHRHHIPPRQLRRLPQCWPDRRRSLTRGRARSSWLLCSRMVLRHPSVWLVVLREEGCLKRSVPHQETRSHRSHLPTRKSSRARFLQGRKAEFRQSFPRQIPPEFRRGDTGRAARHCAKAGDALPEVAALFEGKSLPPLLERGSLRCRSRSRGPRWTPSGKDRSFPRP